MKTELKNFFVSYKIAILLQKKGFNEQCLGVYNCGTEVKLCSENWSDKDSKYEPTHTISNTQYASISDDINFSWVTAPTYQQITDWLRDSHSLIIEIQLDQTSTVKWAYDITKFNGFMDFERKTNVAEWSLYRDYYEALDSAINEALKLIP